MKEPYLNPKGLWGDRFWTRNADKADFTIADGARFSKVYFKAGIAGYTIGMIVTLYVCNAFSHAQPALLYLVPGVLIALWGTAFFRNELDPMWEYTEDGKWGWDNEKQDGESKPSVLGTVAAETEEKQKALNKEASDHAHHVFLLSLSEPKHELSKEKSS